MTPTAVTVYTVSKLKTWNTHDGGGFQATIAINGKALAVATNDGNGGPTDVDFLPGMLHLRGAFIAWCMAEAGKEDPTFTKWESTAVDVVVAHLIDDLTEQRFVVRVSKTKTLFKLPTDGKGAFHTINRPWSPELEAHILTTYPGAVLVRPTPKA